MPTGHMNGTAGASQRKVAQILTAGCKSGAAVVRGSNRESPSASHCWAGGDASPQGRDPDTAPHDATASGRHRTSVWAVGRGIWVPRQHTPFQTGRDRRGVGGRGGAGGEVQRPPSPSIVLPATTERCRAPASSPSPRPDRQGPASRPVRARLLGCSSHLNRMPEICFYFLRSSPPSQAQERRQLCISPSIPGPFRTQPLRLT